jgi:hypothetical protein
MECPIFGRDEDHLEEQPTLKLTPPPPKKLKLKKRKKILLKTHEMPNIWRR